MSGVNRHGRMQTFLANKWLRRFFFAGETLKSLPASFSHRSSPQRIEWQTPRAFACCGLAGPRVDPLSRDCLESNRVVMKS